MRYTLCSAPINILALLLCMFGAKAQGNVAISLVSTGNPQTLSVGQSITFQVQMAGLQANQELDSLGVTVSYNSSLLGEPTIVASSLTQGGIIPDSLADPYDLLLAPMAGQADATFMTESDNPDHHIKNNGIFFTFETVAPEVGEGQVSIDAVYATYFNSDSPGSPIPATVVKGGPLGFCIIVPEPAGIVLILTLAVGLLMRRLVR